MSNIRILAEEHLVDTSIRSVALFGGIDYETEPLITAGGNSSEYTSSDTSKSFTELRKIRGGKWTALPGTTNEIGDIQNIATTLKIPVITYSIKNASEESFKLLGDGKKPAPSIMHIATHGFAFSMQREKPQEERLPNIDKRQPIFKQSEDPLTRAGLVMAGGNHVWTKGTPYLNREDGILTAREVSNLDLRGCVLAILSACQTGLGDIKGSEGVFGLQRAFKMAGVQNLIVSLWQVPDKETVEFMRTFYTNWLKQKLPIKEAFRQTQLTLSKKYEPYQWAAFVLAE
jgi:CHAT domain-containing protein